MILAVDIGNTKISTALYKNNKIVSMFDFICPHNISAEKLENIIKSNFQNISIKNCIISSVADELTEKVKNAVLKLFNVNSLIVNIDLKLGINIKSGKPEKIGSDRIANAYAASKLYKKRPLIVVDSGSATTFDIVDTENNFIGGLIMPGLDMQLKSLSDNTSKLPEISLNSAESVHTYINTDTEKAILSGVVFGQAQAIQGLIAQCEKELKTKAFVIGTGGNAELLAEHMQTRKFDVVNPTLTLDGINMIYKLNTD